MNKILKFGIHSEDKDRIKEMARRYFSRNPRLVKSFVRDLAFLTSTIKPRYEYLTTKEKRTPEEKQERKNLQEIIDNPALLAKIIVIRENFPEDFAKIQKDPTIISKLEENPSLDIPGLSQGIRGFILSWPLFKESSRKANPANFIFLSGSSGTEFKEEIDVGQFINYANTGDVENFYLALSKSPRYKLVEYLTSVIDTYNSSTDETVKANISKAVMSALHLVENINEHNGLLDLVIPWAENNNGIIFNQLTTDQIQRWIKGIIGTSKETEQLSKIITAIPYGNTNEEIRNRFWEAFTLPGLPYSAIGRFAEFLSQLLKDSSFTNKQFILEIFQKGNFASQVTKTPQRMNVGNNLSEFCVSQPYSDEEIRSINLLESIFPDDDHKRILIEHLINWVSIGDENQKGFAKQNLVKINLWPTDSKNLTILKTEFLNYYTNLPPDEQGGYQLILDFFKRKGVRDGKTKRKPVSK